MRTIAIVFSLQLILIMCKDVVLSKDVQTPQSFLSNIVMYKRICLALGYIPCQGGHVNNGKQLMNVALRKKVKQSSYFDRKQYPDTLAVNGIIDDIAVTNQESKPWILIDLGKQHQLYEIEVYNRKDGFGSRFRHVKFTVGKTYGNMKICGRFAGPGSNGERITVRCPRIMTARFVKIQIMKGPKTYLNIAEILVWGTKI